MKIRRRCQQPRGVAILEIPDWSYIRTVPKDADDPLVAAIKAVFSNTLRRRIVTTLLDQGGRMRYGALRRASKPSGNDQFQRAVQDLIDHVVVDRHLVPDGEQSSGRMASDLRLSPRGERIARAMQGLAHGRAEPSREHALVAAALLGRLDA